MIRRALSIGTLALVALVLLTGCGSDRPREVSMSDTKPCQFIPQSDFPRLRVAGTPQSLDSPPGVDVEGTACYYLLRTGNNVAVNAITNHGIDRWTSGSLEHARFKDVPRIQGFRTIQVWFTYDTAAPHHTCRLYVDVAGGQSLEVDVGENSEDDPPTCTTARRFAEAAMSTLVR